MSYRKYHFLRADYQFHPVIGKLKSTAASNTSVDDFVKLQTKHLPITSVALPNNMPLIVGSGKRISVLFFKLKALHSNIYLINLLGYSIIPQMQAGEHFKKLQSVTNMQSTRSNLVRV